MSKYFLVIIFIVSTTVLFQNCGDVRLKGSESSSGVSKVSGIRGEYCLRHPDDASADTYSYLRFYVLPITGLPKGNLIVADSDMDGIADINEVSLAATTQRRITGILDILCTLPSCRPVVGSCDESVSYFYGGITQCDLAAFQGEGVKGLNLDGIVGALNSQDYIPDFIEALRRGRLADADTVSSNGDGDLVSNEAEIIQNSDLTDPNSYLSTNKIGVEEELSKTSHADCGTSKSVSFSISRVPTVPVSAFDDGSRLSHVQNENVVLIVVVSKSLSGRIQYQSFPMKVPHNDSNFNFVIRPKDFHLEGTY